MRERLKIALITAAGALTVRELHARRARNAIGNRAGSDKRLVTQREHEEKKRKDWVTEGKKLLEQSGLDGEILLIKPRLDEKPSEIGGPPIQVLAFSWRQADADPEDPSQIHDSQVALKVVIPNVDDENDAPSISLQFRDFELYKGGRVRDSLEQGRPDLAVMDAFSAKVTLNQAAHDGLFS